MRPLPAFCAFFLLAGAVFSLPSLTSAQVVTTLRQGQTIEKELAGGQTHNYQMALAAGQFAQVAIEQRGVDVVIAVAGSDGARLAEIDQQPDTRGTESVLLVAAATGNYRIEISAREKDVFGGRYEIKVADLRTATPADRERVAAEYAQLAGEQLLAQTTSEAAQLSVGKFQEALQLSRRLNDRQREAVALYSLGRAFRALGDGAAALNYYNQALALFQTSGSGSWGEVFGNLNLFYTLMGGQQKALDYLSGALPLVRALRNHQLEAILRTAIARIHLDLNQQAPALEHYQQALALFRLTGNRTGASINLTDIGDADLSLAEQQKARDYLMQALALVRMVGDRALEATLLAGLSYVSDLLDESQRGHDYRQQALALYRTLGDRNGEAYMLNFNGVFYLATGDYQQAQDSFEQALQLFQAVKDRDATAHALSSLGMAHFYAGDLAKAQTCFTQTLPIFRAVGDRYGEANALLNLGEIQWRQQEKSQALATTTQALRLWQALGYRNGEAWTLVELGFIHAYSGAPQKAQEPLQRALQLFREIGNRSGEAQALYGLAYLEKTFGQLQAARTRLEAALEIIETQRAKLLSQDARVSFLALRQSYYQFHREVLMQLHRREPNRGFEAAALQANELARARSLLETLNEARADIRQGVDPVLLERERGVQRQLNAQERARMLLLGRQHTPAQAAAAEKELRELTAQYRELQAQIRINSPRYAALTQPQPLKVAEIQQQVLDADTLLLEYALGEERSYLWAVTQTGITSYELPKGADIEAAARHFYATLSTSDQPARAADANNGLPAAARATSASGAALSQMLLAPVAGQLTKKRLLIVADGALQYVPFAALAKPTLSGRVLTNASPLITEHEIVSLPSASSLALLRRELAGRPVAPKTLALFADPVFSVDDARIARTQAQPAPSGAASAVSNQTRTPELLLTRALNETGVATAGLRIPRLPGTRLEAAAISALVPASERKQALDFDASRVFATSAELGQYRIIHFATHGLLNSQHPELSGVVLSLVDRQGQPQEGFLRLHELYNLKIPAELVVLSACQTGLGKEVKGEGLIGLTRGFMYAGAARVLASLWKVDDRATAELMKHFYQGMLQAGLSPAAALRAAQMQLQQQPRWHEPYYWAGFVLQGEWK